MTAYNKNTGVFVISLDYELMWGVWDVTTVEKYGNNILGVKQAIPKMLQLFEQHGIKTTFASVGFLFAKDKNELLASIPGVKPVYDNNNYNVYTRELTKTGVNEEEDPYHFGYGDLALVKNCGHEIATHTHSHFFCLEEGQTAEQFDADIKAALSIARANGIQISSMVFPRNQINDTYLPVLANNGIEVYRGNPVSWIYKPRKFAAEVPFIRLCRLLDTYLPVSGYNTFSIKKQAGLPVNVPASRFLKPYNKNLAWLEKLKLKRIMKEMAIAAKNKEGYHLWWHPHNFGANISENLANLEILLTHYKLLHDKYGFTNLTMKEAAGYS